MSFALTMAFVGQACYLASNYTSVLEVLPNYDVKPCQLSQIKEDYTYVPHIGAYKLHTDATTWAQAIKICQSEGGDLAIINSVAESQAFVSLFEAVKDVPKGSAEDINYALIGFHDRFIEGDYMTLKTQSLAEAGFDEFAEGEPTSVGVGPERCGSVYKDGKLNNIGCERLFRFICELSYPWVTYE